MASEIGNTASDDEITALTDDPKAEKSDLLDGRVWRRVNAVISADSSGGPVLRTTLKPVKRFRPESNTDKSTNPSPNRKKKFKVISCNSTKSDETGSTTDGKKILNGESGAVIALDQSQGSTLDTEKLQSGSQVAGDGNFPLKKKRPREQWSVEDKDFFFEAIAVYGKDFEAIRSAIAQKHRRKGQHSLAKTKEQVRHFYYRTWTTINKMIDADSYPPEINKAFQELFALINYGELRRKLGENLKKRSLDKLNELIKHGTTSARVKGKNFRIKTPSCRALKKLSPEYQGKEGALDLPLVSDTRRMKIPRCVTVELYPLTMADWNQVHSYAHNPRLRLRVSVESQLSSLFGYLNRKWKPPSERLMSFAAKALLISDETKNQASNSKPTSSLILQTPSDASVNTRIMVFQVSSNKGHAIVSYALRKATRTSDKSSRYTVEKTQDDTKASDVSVYEPVGGAVSETEAFDSCLSSEEDDEYDSANDDTAKISKPDHFEEGDSANKTACLATADESSPQALNINFTLKVKDVINNFCSDSLGGIAPSNQDCLDDQEQTSMTEADMPKQNCSSENMSETSGKPAEDVVKVADAAFGTTVELSMDSETVNPPTTEIATEGGSVDEESNKNHEDTDSSKTKEISQVEPTNNVSEETLKNQGEGTQTNKVTFADSKYVEKARPRKKCKPAKNTDFIKTVQSWNLEDSGNTTIAQLYMMLGKPSLFKLCYHWLHNNKQGETKMNKNSPADDKFSQPDSSLSSGLYALLQTAGVSKQVRDSEISQQKIEESKAICQKSTKSMAVQCELINDPCKVSEGIALSVASSTAGNPHGRGLSKMVCANTTPVTIVQPTAEFVVPTLPVPGRRKPIDNDSKNMKVSPQTMNYFIHRERLRNRLIRRPIVVDRNVQSRPPRSTMRPMRTFSIVTQGSKKVGFVPSNTVAVPMEESVVDPQNDNSERVANKIPETNLLAQAAQEAGVFPCTNSSSFTTINSIPDMTAVSSNDNALMNFAISKVGSTQHMPGISGARVEGDVSGLSIFGLQTVDVNCTTSQKEVNSSNSLQNHVPSNPQLVAGDEDTRTLKTTEFHDQPSSAMTFVPIDNQSDVTELNIVKGIDGEIEALHNHDVLGTPNMEASNYLAVTSQKMLQVDDAEILGTSEYVATTPQKIFPSDSEDSFDGILIRQNRRSGVIQRSANAPCFDARVDSILGDPRAVSVDSRDLMSSSTDIALDLQLPTLIGDNSVDLMSKFQDLVRHTNEGSELNTLANDDNARDRPLCETPFHFPSPGGFDNG